MDSLLLFWTCIYGYYGEITADVSPFSICLVNFHALDKRISENSYFNYFLKNFFNLLTGAGVNRQYFHSGFAGYFSYYRRFCLKSALVCLVNDKTLRNHNVWSQTAEPYCGAILRSFCSGVFAPEHFMGFGKRHEFIVIFRVIFAFAMCQVLHLICLVVPAVGLICSYHMQLLTLRIFFFYLPCIHLGLLYVAYMMQVD